MTEEVDPFKYMKKYIFEQDLFQIRTCSCDFITTKFSEKKS